MSCLTLRLGLFTVDVVSTSKLPEALNTLDMIQTTSQNHSEKTVPRKVVDNELKVEIKQELLLPSSSQRNSVQPPIHPETMDERTSKKQGEDESKLMQENPDIVKSDVNQEEMEVCETKANNEPGAAEQVQPNTEEPMEAEVVHEPETSSSVSLPGEEEKMEVDKDSKLSTQHEGEEAEKGKEEEEQAEKAKEEGAEKVEEQKVKSPEGDESHEHMTPASVEPLLPSEVKQEKDANEQNGEEKVKHVLHEDALSTTAPMEGSAKPESASVETSSVQPEVTQPTPEKLAPVEEKQEVQELVLSVELGVTDVLYCYV